MSRKLPDEYHGREQSRYRNVGLVLWSALICVGIVVGAAVIPQADSPERSPSASADVEALSSAESVESERAAERRADEPDADEQVNSAVAFADSLFPNSNVSLDVDPRTGIDFDVSTGAVDVSFSGLGGNETSQSGTINHEAIDSGVERSSSAGLCAVGLDGSNAPANVDVDGENGTVRAEFNETRSEPSDEKRDDPASVVERCGTWDE